MAEPEGIRETHDSQNNSVTGGRNTRAAVIGAVILGLRVYQTHSDQLPDDIKKSVSFPVYYPSKLPQGYSLDKNSAKTANGIVLFSLVFGGKKILISEQTRPSHPPDLIALTKPQKAQLPVGLSGITPPTLAPKFKEIDCPVGLAVQGANVSGSPTAIVLTDSTLVNMTGSSTLSDAAISEIIQNLKRITY
jgi:hypothetical protein